MTAPWQRPSTGTPAALAARLASLVPTLDTARLRLRAPRIEDFPIYARFMFDEPGAALGKGDTGEAAWLDFCQIVAGWSLRGFGSWTVETRAGGTPVGAVVVNHEYGDPEVEIGWVVTPVAEGMGYATEAAACARDYAFSAMGFASLVSYVAHANERSMAVARRLGAARDPRAEAALDHACFVFRHARGDRA